MPTVIHNQDNILEVGEDWLTRLKEEAEQAPRRRAREITREPFDASGTVYPDP